MGHVICWCLTPALQEVEDVSVGLWGTESSQLLSVPSLSRHLQGMDYCGWSRWRVFMNQSYSRTFPTPGKGLWAGWSVKVACSYSFWETVSSFFGTPFAPPNAGKTCLHSHPLAAETTHFLLPNTYPKQIRKNNNKLRWAPLASLRPPSGCSPVLQSGRSPGPSSHCSGHGSDWVWAQGEGGVSGLLCH